MKARYWRWEFPTRRITVYCAGVVQILTTIYYKPDCDRVGDGERLNTQNSNLIPSSLSPIAVVSVYKDPLPTYYLLQPSRCHSIRNCRPLYPKSNLPAQPTFQLMLQVFRPFLRPYMPEPLQVAHQDRGTFCTNDDIGHQNPTTRRSRHRTGSLPWPTAGTLTSGHERTGPSSVGATTRYVDKGLLLYIYDVSRRYTSVHVTRMPVRLTRTPLARSTEGGREHLFHHRGSCTAQTSSTQWIRVPHLGAEQ